MILISLRRPFERPLFKVGKHRDSCRLQSHICFSSALGERQGETDVCFKSDRVYILFLTGNKSHFCWLSIMFYASPLCTDCSRLVKCIFLFSFLIKKQNHHDSGESHVLSTWSSFEVLSDSEDLFWK